MAQPPQRFNHVLTLHNGYVGFLLPLRIEVQCYEWAEGVDANSLPEG